MRDLLELIESYLVEYKRDITAQKMGDKIFAAASRGEYSVTLLHTPEITDAVKQEVINGVLQAIETADPTPNKEYTQWLVKVYSTGTLKLEDINRNGWLSTFNLAKQKNKLQPQHRDINRFKSYREFEDAMMSYPEGSLQPEEKKPVDRGEAQKVYEDNDFRIIIPRDETAACYYGQGTRWCTAASQNNMFNSYNRSGPMYILLPKNPSHVGEKYQFHFHSEQYMDESDDGIDLVEFLTTYPDVKEFFIKAEPAITNQLQFAPREVVESILSQLSDIVTDFLYDEINEMETQNDDYYNYQREFAEENGYTDDDGDIDYERMGEDSSFQSYIEYADMDDYITDVTELLNYSDVIEWASEPGEDRLCTLTQLEMAVSQMISDKLHTRRNAPYHNLITFLDTKVFIKKKDDKYIVSHRKE